MDDIRIVTKGVKEVQKALRQMDADLPKELKVGFTKIAAMVVSAIVPKVPKRSGRAVASIKARGQQRGGAIAFGGSKAPYYPWLDFGGSVGRGHMPGKAWSGAIKRDKITEGRYVYPTIREKRTQIIDETDEMVKKLALRAGFETKEK